MAYHYGNSFRLDHGHRRNGKPSPTYQAWTDMRRRCNNVNHPAYKWYGARGITICERWEVFANFLADMGVCPDGMTLDRKDNNAGYDPSNCRWATWIEQQSNRRTNRLVTCDGQTKTIAEWARSTGILKSTLRERLARGWSDTDAVTRKTIRR